MKSLTSFISIAVLSMMLVAPLSADDVVKVGGRVVEANPAALESAPVSLHLDPASLPVRAARGVSTQADVVLPPLTTQERARLQQPDGDNEMGLRIGIGRDIPDSLGSPNSWNWVAVDGGKVAHLGVTSSGAVRTRVQLQLAELPEGVELRFFSPIEPATVYGPVTRTELAHQPKDAEGKTLFWSPSVAGDTLKLEVFLPDKVPLADIQLVITRLSHVVLDPMSGKTQDGVLEANTAACYLDVACQTPQWQEEALAIGGYLFSDASGDTGFCSGVLVNNSADKKVPYFLTANHCIDTKQEAASMNFVWQYANSSCGSNDASGRAVFTSGGSTLLATDARLDTTLVQLNVDPPKPSYFAGWIAAPLNVQEGVVALHHAALTEGITPKLYSQGYFLGYMGIQGNQLVANNTGEFSSIQWTYGVVEHGGSGSGLWMARKDGYYLNGLLSRGTVSCTNPTGLAFYTRFDQAYPLLKQWLNPTP